MCSFIKTDHAGTNQTPTIYSSYSTDERIETDVIFLKIAELLLCIQGKQKIIIVTVVALLLSNIFYLEIWYIIEGNTCRDEMAFFMSLE